jgi:murein DD-endopeptidase MepM/ murein hydrolase activator NlpD
MDASAPPTPVARTEGEEASMQGEVSTFADGAAAPPPPTSGAAAARSEPQTVEAPPETPPTSLARAALWIAFGVLGIGAAVLPLALGARARERAALRATTTAAASASTVGSAAAGSASAGGMATASASGAAAGGSAPPRTFRVAMLGADADVELGAAVVGTRACRDALVALGLTPTELTNVEAMLAPVRPLKACDADDRLVVARRRSDRQLLALELESDAGQLLRVRSTELRAAGLAPIPNAQPGTLRVESITLPVEHRRTAVAITVDDDLEAAVSAAGLDASLLDALDAALESQRDLPPLTRGAVLRIVADGSYVEGELDRWDELVALEVRPAGTAPDAPIATPGKPGPIRLYHLPESLRAKRAKEGDGHAGKREWWDGRAQQPAGGKWRMPVRFARISSRFNPHRMHPVLHVVMPHNGCDFAAKPGTPVYAIGAGTAQFVGESGPSGNLVTIAHEGGLESGYAHLSRFAPGLAPGAVVEPRTLIGYVGTTGRSTGPHLHLSLKKNGAFIDPLSLKLDGVRVVPPSHRDAFSKRKAADDAALDAIALPPPLPPAPPSAAPSASCSASPSTSASSLGEEDEAPAKGR